MENKPVKKLDSYDLLCESLIELMDRIQLVGAIGQVGRFVELRNEIKYRLENGYICDGCREKAEAHPDEPQTPS